VIFRYSFEFVTLHIHTLVCTQSSWSLDIHWSLWHYISTHLCVHRVRDLEIFIWVCDITYPHTVHTPPVLSCKGWLVLVVKCSCVHRVRDLQIINWVRDVTYPHTLHTSPVLSCKGWLVLVVKCMCVHRVRDFEIIHWVRDIPHPLLFTLRPHLAARKCDQY